MLFIKHLQYNSIRISEAPEVGGQVSQLGEFIGNTRRCSAVSRFGIKLGRVIAVMSRL